MIKWAGLLFGVFCLTPLAIADSPYSSLTTVAPHWCLTDAAGTVVPTCQAPSINDWQTDTPNHWDSYYDHTMTPIQPSLALQSGDGAIEVFMGMDTAKTALQIQPSDKVKALGLSAASLPITNWQNIDELIYFGGYVADGQVLAPTPGWINAAHKNGVKILGTVFLNSMATGGNPEFNALNHLFTPASDGTYPVADQLIAIAKAYGFDGFFINEETNPFIKDSLVQPFVKYFHKKAHSEGLDLDCDWYVADISSMTTDILQDSQTHELIVDHAFIDYAWQAPNFMQQFMGIFEQTTYPIQAIQFPIDADGAADAGSQKSMMALIPKGASLSEFDFQNVLSPGGKADAEPSLQNQNENNFWNQSIYTPPQHAVITALPFLTQFNTGQGLTYFVDGIDQSYGAWNNIGQQDYLPTYQNKSIHTGTPSNQLTESYAYSTAYTGGTSLQIQGNLVKDSTTTFDLYALQASITADDLVEAISQSSDPTAADVSICLTIHAQQNCFLIYPGEQSWHNDIQSLSSTQGTLTDISLMITSKQTKAYQLNLGQSYLGSQLPKPSAPNQAVLSNINHLEILHEQSFYHSLVTIDPNHNDTIHLTRIYYLDSWLGSTNANTYDVITKAPIQINQIMLSNVNAQGIASDLAPISGSR